MEKPIEYEQTDARWRNVLYTVTGNARQTIGTAGCGTTAAAMVISTLRDKTINPYVTSAWSVKNGYRTNNDGTSWAFFPAIMRKYDIPCISTASANNAIAALRKGYLVIAAAGRGIWTTGGHIILAYGLSKDEKKVYIHDPNSEAPHRELANIANFRSECVHFWIIEEKWREEKVDIKTIKVNHKELGMVEMRAVNVGGENYVRLRDVEKISPIVVDWDGKNPTVKSNIKQ